VASEAIETPEGTVKTVAATTYFQAAIDETRRPSET